VPAIEDPFVFTALSCLTVAVGALWGALVFVVKRLGTLIGSEAKCQAQLESMKQQQTDNHNENTRLLAPVAKLLEDRMPPDR
jgi:Na+-transporting methylmalonyl-CoA/oxaloacetate decarboxylase gamma subunit